MFLQSHANAECNSDEADSRSGGAGGNRGSEDEQRASASYYKRRKHTGRAPVPAPGKTSEVAAGDGLPAEAPRRPRGRPPGSKNKPKPPIIVTRDADDEPSSPAVLQPYVLEINAGDDVIGSLARFSRRRNLGLSVLAGIGVVSDVVLHSSGTLSFPGAFEILSISATFFPPSFSGPSSAQQLGGAAVTLAGPHGQIFGGLVAGPLRAAATVTIVAATFSSPSYHRLPAEDDVSVSVSVNCEPLPAPSHYQRQKQNSSPPPSSSPATKGHRHRQPTSAHGVSEPCGLSIFSSHLPSDVIWAPAARSPPY